MPFSLTMASAVVLLCLFSPKVTDCSQNNEFRASELEDLVQWLLVFTKASSEFRGDEMFFNKDGRLYFIWQGSLCRNKQRVILYVAVFYLARKTAGYILYWQDVFWPVRQWAMFYLAECSVAWKFFWFFSKDRTSFFFYAAHLDRVPAKLVGTPEPCLILWERYPVGNQKTTQPLYDVAFNGTTWAGEASRSRPKSHLNRERLINMNATGKSTFLAFSSSCDT